jgi:hypothetical protein
MSDAAPPRPTPSLGARQLAPDSRRVFLVALGVGMGMAVVCGIVVVILVRGPSPELIAPLPPPAPVRAEVPARAAPVGGQLQPVARPDIGSSLPPGPPPGPVATPDGTRVAPPPAQEPSRVGPAAASSVAGIDDNDPPPLGVRRQPVVRAVAGAGLGPAPPIPQRRKSPEAAPALAPVSAQPVTSPVAPARGDPDGPGLPTPLARPAPPAAPAPPAPPAPRESSRDADLPLPPSVEFR